MIPSSAGGAVEAAVSASASPSASPSAGPLPAGDAEPPPDSGGRAAGRFVVQNRQRRFPVDAAGLAAFLVRVAEDAAPGDRRAATLRVLSDRKMRELNRRFREKDRPTDVLAFPAGAPEEGAFGGEPAYLGDLAVSAETAARQAAERGHPLETELRLLALHGVLHLLGWDHERDRGEMERLERLLRRRHGLAPASAAGGPAAGGSSAGGSAAGGEGSA